MNVVFLGISGCFGPPACQKKRGARKRRQGPLQGVFLTSRRRKKEAPEGASFPLTTLPKIQGL